MALYKQWELLNKCVEENSEKVNSPRLIAVPYEKTSSNGKKSSHKNSAKKDNQVRPKVLAEKTNSNTKKKEPVLVEPVYPKIPAALPKSTIPVVKANFEDEDVITLSGAQLKCLIKDFARQSIKTELAKVLQ